LLGRVDGGVILAHIVYTLERLEEELIGLMLVEEVVAFFSEMASLLHPVKNSV